MDMKFQPVEHEAITELLRTHQITPTSQRVKIAGILFAAPAHFCAEELYARVNQDDADVSKATVYNTLGLFVAKGLVRQVFVEPGRVFYDSNTQPHHHFYDTDRTELTDIDAVGVALNELPPLPAETELDSVDVIVRIRQRQPKPRQA
jgi:Fur family iron response transcriptional regulator